MSTQHKASQDSHNSKHQQAIETSRRYLNTIKSKTISRAAAEALIAETLRNFANHYNPGFLEYRKSVTKGASSPPSSGAGAAPPSPTRLAAPSSTASAATGCSASAGRMRK